MSTLPSVAGRLALPIVFGMVVSMTSIPTTVFAQRENAKTETLPSPSEIVEAHIEAIGGQMPLLALESYQSTLAGETSEESGDSNKVLGKYNAKYVWAKDKGWCINQESKAGIGRCGVFGGRPWRQGPRQEPELVNDLGEIELTQSNLFYTIAESLELRDAIDSSTTSHEVTGITQIIEHDVYVLVSEGGTKRQTTRYFDKESGLLLSLKYKLAEHQFQYYFDDFRDVDGIKVAHKRKAVLQVGRTYRVTTTARLQSVNLNVAIDEALLNPPKSRLDD